MIRTIATPYTKGNSLTKYALLNGVLLFILLLSTVSAQAQTVDLATASDTGTNTTDNITSDTTPDIVVAGYGGSDSITVTATHATASDVTASNTGNGTVTLGTLAEGVWSITADAGGTSSNTLEIMVLAEMASTMGQSDGAEQLVGEVSSPTSRKVAQKFTTGNASYVLKELHFDISEAFAYLRGTSDHFEIEIMTANGNDPGTRVQLFNSGDITESTLSVGEYKYSIPSNKYVTLAPNTDYFVLFQIKFAADATLKLRKTASNDETGQTGWSVADACRTTDVTTGNSGQPAFGNIGTWSNCASSNALKIGLYGNAIQPVIDLATASDTGTNTSDNITSDTTPDIVVAGYDGSDSITVTATHATASDAAADITGNGTVTLGALAEGVWSITANAGGTRSNTLEITVLAEMVSTMGQSDGVTFSVGGYGSDQTRKIAQKFTTGNAPYSLKELHFDISQAFSQGSADHVEIEIMTADGDDPGTRVVIFNSGDIDESTLSAGDYKYSVSSSNYTTLAPNTDYFILFQVKTSHHSRVGIQGTASDSQTGETGWSVADVCRETSVISGSSNFGNVGTWGDCGSSNAVKFGLYGSSIPFIDLKDSSDTGASDTDNITTDNTPTFTVSGLDNSASVTVTADHATLADVTLTQTGNGDFTLTALADGEWSVSATDGTDTTDPISVTVANVYVQVYEEDDTTHALVQRDRTKEAWTRVTRPRFTGYSPPSASVRLYRVSKAQFDAASTGSEWTELAVDGNKIFDGTATEDGIFQIAAPPNALSDGIHYLAARMSLDGGTTYTDAVRIFTLTIDTAKPERTRARDETIDGVLQEKQPLVVFDNVVVGNGYTSSDTDILTGNDDFQLQHISDTQVGTDLHVEVRVQGTEAVYYRAPGFGDVTAKVGTTFSTATDPGFPQSILDSNGEYRLRFTITDKAGNQYQEFVEPFIFDNEAPEIQIIQVGERSFLIYATDNVDTDITFKASGRETANCRRERHAFTAYAAGTLFELSQPTLQFVCVSAVDDAGNIAFKSSKDAAAGVAQLKLLQTDDTGYSDTDSVTNKEAVTITGTVAEGTIARLFYRRIKDARGTPVTEEWQQFSQDVLPVAGQTTVTFTNVRFTQEGTYQLGGATNTVDSAIGSGTTYDGNFFPQTTPTASGELIIDRTAIHKLDDRFLLSERGHDLIDPKLLLSYPVRLENFFDLNPEDGIVQVTASWGPYSDTANKNFQALPYTPRATYSNCAPTAPRDACEVHFAHIDLVFSFFAPRELRDTDPTRAHSDYEAKRIMIDSNTIPCADFKANAAFWEQVKADLIAEGIDANNIILPYSETCVSTISTANGFIRQAFVNRTQKLREEAAAVHPDYLDATLFRFIPISDIPQVYVLGVGATSAGRPPIEVLGEGKSVTHPFSVTITDKAGNTVSIQAAKPLTTDAAPPVATLYRDEEDYWVEARDPSYTRTFGEAGVTSPTKVFIVKGAEATYTQRSKNCGELAQQKDDFIALGVPAENIFAPFTFPCTDSEAVATREEILQSGVAYVARQTVLIQEKVDEDPNDAITQTSHVTFAMLPTLYQLGVGASSKMQEISGTQPLENTCSSEGVAQVKGPFLGISDDRIVTKGEIGDSDYKISILKQDHFTTDSFGLNVFNEALASDRYSVEAFCVVVTDAFGSQTFLLSTEATIKQRKKPGKEGGIGGRIGGNVTGSLIPSLSDLFDTGEQAEQKAPTIPVFDVGQQRQQEQTAAFVEEATSFTRDLTIGSIGADVRALQKMLNDLGFIVSTTGAGSPGKESVYFGEKTRQALIRYQISKGITPASGYFGPRTRAQIQGQAQGQLQPTAPVEEVRSFVDTATEEEHQPAPTVSVVIEETTSFTRDLTIGSIGADVRALQSMLNTLGFIVSTTGAGSPGEESVYFGEKTRQALIRYQEANSITPAFGYFGPRTRAQIQGQPTAPVEEVRSFIETAEQEEEERREQQSSPEQQQKEERQEQQVSPEPLQQQEVQTEDITDYDPITNLLFPVR